MAKSLFNSIAALCLAAWGMAAHAALTIEITQGVERGMPVAIVPFAWEGPGTPIQEVGGIVQANLVRSGRFEAIPENDFLSRPHDDGEVVFKDWRLIKAEALVIGKVRDLGGDRYAVQFQLYDVFRGAQLAGYRYTVEGRHLRRVGHQISDIVYEKLTGEPGAFDTRIAYVTLERGGGRNRYLLQIADSDGYNPVTILESREPIMSPAWSPDGSQLAYVSFEDGRSMVYLQNLADGGRKRIADHEGLNSAPAWSPDGRELALVLSKDGNPEIYRYRLNDGRLMRLTSHLAIDTEPAWSPDGRQIVFTSDRSGSPQLYRMGRDGGATQRLTFEGRYNARADFSRDGRTLSLVTGDGSGFRIAVLRLDNLALQILTDSRLDESPSFAPNGRMILYASERQGRGVLAAVSADGRVQQMLRFQQGDVREPDWSPFNRKL